jgi:hypothetical protein
MLVPAGLLALVFVFALIPDIVLHEPEVPEADEEAAVLAPLAPGSLAQWRNGTVPAGSSCQLA